MRIFPILAVSVALALAGCGTQVQKAIWARKDRRALKAHRASKACLEHKARPGRKVHRDHKAPPDRRATQPRSIFAQFRLTAP
jgi:hypothetical protein